MAKKRAARKPWQPKDMIDQKFVKDLEKLTKLCFDRAYELDWSWSRLAREADVSYGTISRLGHFESPRCQFRSVYRMARAVGLTVELAEVKRKQSKRAA